MSSTAPLASPASSISSFSMIDHPHASWDSAVLVESGSDDDNDEIVFYPRNATVGNQGLVRAASFDSDDDYILIASPRTSATPALTGLAFVPAPSRTLDEQLVTPTRADSNAPLPASGLPTPSSSGTSNRSQTSVARKVDDNGKSSPTPSQASSSSKRRNRRRKAAKPTACARTVNSSAASYPSPLPSPIRATGSKSTITTISRAKDIRNATAPVSATRAQTPKGSLSRLDKLAADCEGIGARGVVVEDDDETTLYQAAVNYISSFLANPDDNNSRLPLLQALIIELGVCSPTSPLPASMRAAKALLNAKAHINVRDYIGARGKGLAALQEVMHPTKSLLMKDLRKRRVPIKWVKEHGLSMLLVHF